MWRISLTCCGLPLSVFFFLEKNGILNLLLSNFSELGVGNDSCLVFSYKTHDGKMRTYFLNVSSGQM